MPTHAHIDHPMGGEDVICNDHSLLLLQYPDWIDCNEPCDRCYECSRIAQAAADEKAANEAYYHLYGYCACGDTSRPDVCLIGQAEKDQAARDKQAMLAWFQQHELPHIDIDDLPF